MKTCLLLLTLVLAVPLSAQRVDPRLKDAQTAHQQKDYARALGLYEAVLRDDPIEPLALFNGACAAAQLGHLDLAFGLLDRAFPAGEEWLVGRTALPKDSDLKPLHADPRWPALLATVEKRYADLQAGPLAPVKQELLAIHEADQAGRQKIREIEQKHGRNSPEMQALWQEIATTDAANVTKVTAILDQHGWLGPRQIGRKANSALFLVIQHADLPVQQKYLPLMRAAVKAGHAAAHSLALLEDRVSLREGRPQIYGSQIGTDPATGQSYVMPLSDPDRVDERRAAVGLGPLADYAQHFGITWDLAAYKQQLPTLRNPFVP